MKYGRLKEHRLYLVGGILLGLSLLSLGVIWLNQATPAQQMAISVVPSYSESLEAKEKKLEPFSNLGRQAGSEIPVKGKSAGTQPADENNEQKITAGDLPSPVKGTPLRAAGNYYSAALQAYVFHAGTDYAVAEGTVIRATHAGKVIYAGPDPLLGQKVTIDCGQGWAVTYGGLDNLQVSYGEQVTVNSGLGQIGYHPGAEGVAAQSQLHYEIWHGDQVIVPAR